MLNCLLVSTVEIVVAVMAVIVAAASAVITLIFGISQRKHNINSVRPIPSIVLANNNDEIYVKLINVGTGPLIIKKLRFKNDGMEADNLVAILFDMCNTIKDYNSEHTNHQIYLSYIGNKLDDEPIGINGEEVLIRISPLSEKIRKVVRSNLAKISMTLEYSDVYNKNYSYGPFSFECFEKKDNLE